MGTGTGTTPYYDYSNFANSGDYAGWQNKIFSNYYNTGTKQLNPYEAYGYYSDYAKMLDTMKAQNGTIKDYFTSDMLRTSTGITEGGTYNDWLNTWGKAYGNDWNTIAAKYASYNQVGAKLNQTGTNTLTGNVPPVSLSDWKDLYQQWYTDSRTGNPREFNNWWQSLQSAYAGKYGVPKADSLEVWSRLNAIYDNPNKYFTTNEKTEQTTWNLPWAAPDTGGNTGGGTTGGGDTGGTTPPVVKTPADYLSGWKTSAWGDYADVNDALQQYRDNNGLLSYSTQVTGQVSQLEKDKASALAALENERARIGEDEYNTTKQQIESGYDEKISASGNIYNDWLNKWNTMSTAFGYKYGEGTNPSDQEMGSWLSNYWEGLMNGTVNPDNDDVPGNNTQDWWDDWTNKQKGYYQDYLVNLRKTKFNDKSLTDPSAKKNLQDWILVNDINRGDDPSKWTGDQWNAWFYSRDIDDVQLLQGYRSLNDYGTIAEDKEFQQWAIDNIINGGASNLGKLNAADYKQDTTSDYYKNLQKQASQGYGQGWERSSYESAIAPYAQQYGDYVRQLQMQQGKTGVQSGFANQAQQAAKYQLSSTGLSQLAGIRQQQEDYKYQAKASMADIDNSNRAIQQSVDQYNADVTQQKLQQKLYAQQTEDQYEYYKKARDKGEEIDWMQLLESAPGLIGLISGWL